MKQYVIIGNSIAAAGVIEGIRTADQTGAITVLSGEEYPVYARPLISYYLEGKTDRERMRYRPADFYEKNGCTVLYGKQVVGIDPAARTVSLRDGESLPYDELCVAAGFHPFVPPFAGLDTVERPYAFTTLSDALALEQAVAKASRVLIVGAGLIGLKCAEGLSGRAGSITVCDLAPHILSSILDGEGAALMERHLTAHGVHLLLGSSVERFSPGMARMQSGEDVPFDVLVLAIGTRPNTALLRSCGGKVGRGIIVTPRMETSLPHIYAAGDCTENLDVSSGESGLLSILPNAALEGRVAGANMAGGDAVFENGIRMNSIGFFGLHIMTAGTYFSPQDGASVDCETWEGGYKKLFCRDGFLTGYILIGNVDRAGIYTNLIRNRIPLNTLDGAALKKNPALLPFGPQRRGKILEGVV